MGRIIHNGEPKLICRVRFGNVARCITVAVGDVLEVRGNAILIGDRREPSQAARFTLAEESAALCGLLRGAAS
jgi:hypothetical protein